MHHTPATIKGRADVDGVGGWFWETLDGAVWFVPDDVLRSINISAHESSPVVDAAHGVIANPSTANFDILRIAINSTEGALRA